jgi:hypothetical protein
MHGHILLSHGQLPYEFVRQIRRGASYLSDKSAAKYFFFFDICKYFPHFFDVSAKKNDFCNIFLQNTVLGAGLSVEKGASVQIQQTQLT